MVGRSLWRADNAARQCGYMEGLPEFMTEDEVNNLPRSRVVFVCTGSQGEPRSALSMIADKAHRRIDLKEGDTVIFSSRIIPGNETSVTALQNKLARMGLIIVTEDINRVHSSGHASKEDLIELYKAIRPKIAIPMHGEPFHLIAHANIARDAGIENVIELKDGDILKIDDKDLSVVDTAETGILAVDGLRTLRIDSESFRQRRKMMYNGSVVTTIIIDKKGKLKAPPVISAIGLFDKGGKEEFEMTKIINEIINSCDKATLKDDKKLSEDIRIALRKYVNSIKGSKPITEVNLIKV
ncbi:MAG: Ribonuclease J 1 [Alphaproteobacteria bacterium ADurb.Bin438]|nr:MAG: Ribonuclease J 1 [Alphaproteobacteria bacterium ADurb.Bin438]